MKKILFWVLLAVLLAVAVFSGYKLISLYMEYRQGEQTYGNLAQYVHIDGTAAQEGDASQGSAQDQGEKVLPTIDYDNLRAINPDLVGWIYIADTNINYPIVQGTDNDEYLYRMFDGTYNAAGSIFMDYRNASDWTDRNTVIYGHNMKNKSMFANVGNYKSQSYYDAHPTGWLLTADGCYELQFFAGYTASEGDRAWDLVFSSQEDYAGWLSQAKQKSVFSSTVTPTAEDRVITLSTCTYDRANARFVLLAVVKPVE